MTSARRERLPSSRKNCKTANAVFRQRILQALPHDDADVHRPLDDDHISHRQRKQKHRKQRENAQTTHGTRSKNPSLFCRSKCDK